MQDYDVEVGPTDAMLLDVILRVRMQDDSLALRKSCREGVCGSDAMNINGHNGLACITPIRDAEGAGGPAAAAGLSGHPGSHRRHERVLQAVSVDQAVRRRRRTDAREGAAQSPEDREKLDGLYECILCACCTSQCPS